MTTNIFSRIEINTLLTLALPMVMTGVMENSVGFFSTLFMAHLGPHELAAGAVVSWIFFTALVIIWGTLTSVSVLVAQKFGEKNPQAISQILRDGLLLAVLLAVPTLIFLRNISPLLLLVGQNPEIVKLGQSYMDAISWGLPADLLAMVLMQFLIGLGHTRTNLFFTLAWVPINIISNYIFVFGKLGAPALGIAGIGWGTSLAFIVLLIVLVIYLHFSKHYRIYLDGIFNRKKPQFLVELIQVGLPMGSMFCLEVAFFLTLTLLMGRFGNSSLAANQITLQFLGMFSVVTFSIAQAITVRLGHTLGAGQTVTAGQITAAGMVIAMSFMVLVAMAYWFIPEKLISIDLNLYLAKNAAIIHYAKIFMIFCALFQIIESLRFCLFGALRSFKDTRFTLLTSILSFWGISLPLGYALAIYFGWNGMGLWAGTIVGQISAVALLFYRFNFKLRGLRSHSMASQN